MQGGYTPDVQHFLNTVHQDYERLDGQLKRLVIRGLSLKTQNFCLMPMVGSSQWQIRDLSMNNNFVQHLLSTAFTVVLLVFAVGSIPGGGKGSAQTRKLAEHLST